GAGGHHDGPGGHGAGPLAPGGPGPGALEGHLPRAVTALTQSAHGGPVHHAGARPLGEPQVVLHQRVLGAVPATGHALAALDARGPVRPHPAEVRVRHGLARLPLAAGLLPEVHADRGVDERVRRPHVLGDGADHLVRVGVRGVGDHTEHPAPLVVERGELGVPVRDVRPLRVLEERGPRLVEGVRVVERAAAHTRAGQDHDVPEQVHALEPEQSQLGRPDVPVQPPRGPGEILVLEAAARLDNGDPVALLRQAARGAAATERGSDDDPVGVGGGRCDARGRRRGGRHRELPEGSKVWATLPESRFARSTPGGHLSNPWSPTPRDGPPPDDPPPNTTATGQDRTDRSTFWNPLTSEYPHLAMARRSPPMRLRVPSGTFVGPSRTSSSGASAVSSSVSATWPRGTLGCADTESQYTPRPGDSSAPASSGPSTTESAPHATARA